MHLRGAKSISNICMSICKTSRNAIIECKLISLQKLMETDTLVLHRNIWGKLYKIEGNAIKQNQGTNFVDIFHIGSTAISDIYAKPKIDMALIVKDLEQSKKLEALNYQYKGCLNIPFRYFYSKKTDKLCAHLHVLLPGDPELDGFLLFRDYLNTHEDVRKEYSELKLKIQKLLETAENEHFLNEYTLAKNDFITSVLRKAGFKGYCMRLVSHYTEQNYEQSVFPQFNKDDIRVIFYKGADIIGYANADIKSKQINFFEVSENAEYFRNRFTAYLRSL